MVFVNGVKPPREREKIYWASPIFTFMKLQNGKCSSAQCCSLSCMRVVAMATWFAVVICSFVFLVLCRVRFLRGLKKKY